ncbi:MAG: DegT/DnrJ/EryC1/StrS family aminotransferase [Acidobacteria bacterium]|nr:DegT/DnrJ/EryC1/StrS family aminotransferase [Acidobacteriota bacterium]
MRVPFLDLAAQLETTRPRVERAIRDVVHSGHYIGGPAVEGFEHAMAERLGVGHAVGVSSGTDALLVTLMALGVGPGDVVLTTPYSFFATVGAILRVGARPAFVDIDPRTYTLDPLELDAWFEREAERREQVRVILPVHLFGQCADMTPVLRTAEAHDARVVEDAAQALGARYPWGADGRTPADADTAGDSATAAAASCYSFYPTKNLGAMGDAGLVATDSPTLAAALRRLRNHGADAGYRHLTVGGNFRLDALQAAILSAKLPYLDAWLEQRRARAAYYDEHLSTVEGVDLPAAVWGRDHHAYHQYVVRVPARRDELRAYLADQQIETMVYYPVPLHLQPCMAALGHGEGDFPVSEAAAARTLALPIYPELTVAMQDRVVEAIAAFYSGRA